MAISSRQYFFPKRRWSCTLGYVLVLLVICSVLSADAHASYGYIREFNYLEIAFKDLRVLYEHYNSRMGTYPVTDDNSTGMYKLAVFLHLTGPPAKSLDHEYRVAHRGLRGVCRYLSKDLEPNKDLLEVESSGFGNTKAELIDYWGNPIEVLIPGKENAVDFYSHGKNGRFDGYAMDDILSWGDSSRRYDVHYPIPWSVRMERKFRVIWLFAPIVVVPGVVLLLIYLFLKPLLFRKPK